MRRRTSHHAGNSSARERVRAGAPPAAPALVAAVLFLLAPALCRAKAPPRDAAAARAPKTEAPNPRGPAPSDSQANGAAPATPRVLDIDEYRVKGADTLPQIEVEEAVYPFLGPRRTPEDVEKARAALEKAYHDKGFQAVNVAIPQQDARNGIVVLEVNENRVGRLRVTGARYFEPARIAKRAPSLAEGKVPNFNAVTRDIAALNQWPDRRVTPALRAGATPGTVDVDLAVEDKLPLHGTVELNNRQSPNTTPLRVNATFTYANLWQLGHSLSFTYVVAPENPSNVTVFSGSYLARHPYNDYMSLLVYGLTSKSNIAAVGGLQVIGPGQTIGARGVFTLPSLESFYHTAAVGFDYKSFGQTILTSTLDPTFTAPVTYYPLVASYNATWFSEGGLTLLGASATAGLRGIGSSPASFDARRLGARQSFIHFNADLAHTQTLPSGLQLVGRVQGQIASEPLVSSEQFAVGGLDTVRGYLEAEVLGDSGFAGTLELRSPNVGELLKALLPTEGAGTPAINLVDEWRIFGFVDGGAAYVLRPPPEQQAQFYLWSYGVGARLRLAGHFNGMILLGVPMLGQTFTEARDPRVMFRIWGEF